jgi:hypothetical protein
MATCAGTFASGAPMNGAGDGLLEAFVGVGDDQLHLGWGRVGGLAQLQDLTDRRTMIINLS